MIVSIYLKEHQYLINSPQTINFGAKYLYSFEERGKKLIVTRKLNSSCIPGFFNISKSKCNVELLSAIVSQNGVGKSSILDVIRSIFVKHKYALPGNSNTILVEDEGEAKVLHSNFSEIYLKEDNKYTEIQKTSKEDYQTIYYSPHFDLKYNPYFDEVDEYDISLDNFIKKDLENTEEKGTNENGWQFWLNEELLHSNSMRQLDFFNSEIYQKNNIFREVFNIPDYEEGILHFRDTNLEHDSEGKIKFWNTPWNLRPIIEEIFRKIEEESDKWHIYRDGLKEQDEEKKQALVNQYLLKRFVVTSYLSLIIHQMEKSNSWLDEGYIEPYNLEGIGQKSALEVFKYFINKSKIKKGEYSKNIFKVKEVFSLFDKLTQLIEKEVDPYKVQKQSIKVKVSEIAEILKCHKNVITQLFDYYPKTSNNLVDKSYYTKGFIEFRPTDKNLSSGENALLNFYSKLYDFINNNLVEERKRLSDKQNYVLLLDEADLGFHPMWKKKFVSAILKSVPFFFENLKMKPTIQIIITTHDPLSLSDIPNNNVVFLKKKNNFCFVLNGKNKIKRTFGANIHDLLADSFFIEDGLIGDFVKEKINETIEWISKNKKISYEKIDKKKLEYHKQFIKLIDEKVLKLKLTEMITELEPDDEYHNQMIDEEIKRLQNLKKQRKCFI